VVRIVERVCLLICASAAMACTGPARVIPHPGGGYGIQTGVQVGWATKRVLSKQNPETLVAEDGTVCRVAPDRYAGTEVKAMVYCDWQPGEPRR
jgi:hypothetical protein